MIKNAPSSSVIELYDQVLHLSNGSKFNLVWRSNIVEFRSCGANSNVIECLEVINNKVDIRQILEGGEHGKYISTEEFNKTFPEEQLDFKCNCHGFTFAHGKYSVTDYYVPAILEDEFEEITSLSKINEGYFDVICLKDKNTNQWVHSCKFRYDLFIHKEGIRKFTVHANLSEILDIPEYKNTEVHYFKINQINCSGICLNAVGEPHVKTFANDNYYSN